MKKIPYILTLLLPFAVFAQLNLVQNPSFETFAGNLPAGWQIIRRGTFENTHFVERKNVLDGNCAVGIENQNETTGKSLLIWGQGISEKVFNTIPAGTKMQFSVYLRAESAAAKAKIYFESVRAAKTFRVRKTITSGSWQKILLILRQTFICSLRERADCFLIKFISVRLIKQTGICLST